MEEPRAEGRERGRGRAGGSEPPAAPPGKELAKAAPFLLSPSARAGAGPRHAENEALGSPVKAPAVPELREGFYHSKKRVFSSRSCLFCAGSILSSPQSLLETWEWLFTWGVESVFSRISTGVHEPVKEIRKRTMKKILGKDAERRFCSPLRSASAGTVPERET